MNDERDTMKCPSCNVLIPFPLELEGTLTKRREIIVGIAGGTFTGITLATLSVLLFAFSLGVFMMNRQAELEKQHDERQQQTVHELQKLVNPDSQPASPAAPSEQAAPICAPHDAGCNLYQWHRIRTTPHSQEFTPIDPEGGPMRVYLSARFQRQEEMRRYADQLRAEAIEVVSAWHDVDSPSSDGFSGLDNQRRAWLAMLDVQQLSGTNVFVSVGYPEFDQVIPAAGMPARAKQAVEWMREAIDSDFTGRHHVETGMALALGKRLLLVGAPENSYHCIPDVEHFPAWPEAVARILELRGSDAMTTRQAAEEAGTTVQQIGMWIREGRLPAAKHNGRYVIGRNDLDRAKALHLRVRADALAAINSDRLIPVKG